MCWKCEAANTCLLAGFFVLFISGGLLKYVFEVSTLDVILLTPVVVVMAFEVAIKILSDMEGWLAIVATFVVGFHIYSTSAAILAHRFSYN